MAAGSKVNLDPQSAQHGAMAKAHSALADPNIRNAIMGILKSQGQGGDTDVVHVNPQEEAMLRHAGGSGAINPTTGLREFDPSGSSGGPNGGSAGGDGNNGNDGGDDGGIGSVGGMGYNRADVTGKSLPGDSGWNNAAPNKGMGGSSGGYNSVPSVNAANPITNAALDAQNDYHNIGNTTADDLGNFLASMFGFNEIDPTKANLNGLTSGTPPAPDASWGFDPAGLIGGILGAGLGIPGLGLIADQISSWAGRPLAVNLGPDVLAGLGLTSSATNAQLGAAMKANPQAGANAANALGGSNVFGGGSDQGGNQPAAGGTTGDTTTPPPVTNPTPTPAADATYQAELAKYMPNLQSDFNFAANQRGLDPAQYGDAYTSELNHRMSQLPVNLSTGTDQSAIDAALSQFLSPNFGTQALDDAQTAKRAALKGGIDGQNFTNDLNTKFGDTADQDILDKIYNEQFGSAKQLLDTTKARGELNDQGYGQGIQDLTNQGIAGKSKLQQVGGNILTSDRGTLNDRLNAIYNSIGGYSLGSSYDPMSDYQALQGKEGQLQGSLEGDIRGVAPSIFDTSTLLQKASSAQGATSNGSLLDTLAQRSMNSGTQNRGLGTTGSF